MKFLLNRIGNTEAKWIRSKIIIPIEDIFFYYPYKYLKWDDQLVRLVRNRTLNVPIPCRKGEHRIVWNTAFSIVWKWTTCSSSLLIDPPWGDGSPPWTPVPFPGGCIKSSSTVELPRWIRIRRRNDPVVTKNTTISIDCHISYDKF